MSLVSVAVAGGALGIRHALEADHVAAVATLVEGDDVRPGIVGASWGVGHTAPIVVLGLAFLLLGVRLPAFLTKWFEVAVGVVLVLLGGRMLLRVVGVRTHTHEDGSEHRHLHLGETSLGMTHSHIDGSAFLIGVLHGFAGSGTLVVLLVSSAPSLGGALAFLGAFGALSICTMGFVSVIWGRGRALELDRPLEALAGGISVSVGFLLLVEQSGGLPV